MKSLRPFVKKHRAPLILFVINLLLNFLWFKDGHLFATAEEGLFFYDLERQRLLISSIWHEVGTGYLLTIFQARLPFITILSFLNQIGLNGVFLQAATFFVITTTASVAMYYLVKSVLSAGFTNRRVEATALVAGLFYLLNPYALTQVFGRALYAQMFAFALLPLFLLLVIAGLEKKKFYYAALAILSTLVFAPAFVMVTQVAVIWVPVLTYFAFRLYTHRKKKEFFFTAVYFAVLVFGWVVVHAWWLLPTFATGNQAFSISNNSLAENIGTLRGVSAHFPFSFVIRLMQNFYFFDAKAYGEIYAHPLFVTISFLIPLILLLGIYYWRKVTNLRFFIIVLLIGLFVSLGSNPPLGGLFEAFFKKFTVLQAFRNPYEKFGLVFMFAYAPIFALGLTRISKAAVLVFLTILCCGIFVWPLWTRDFGGPNAWTRVPSYYKETDDWLNQRGGDFRILQMPLISNDSVLYNWEYKYQGIEPGEFLFTRGSVGRNVIVNKVYYNVLLQRFGNFHPGSFGPDPDIAKSQFAGNNLSEELAKLNVRYLVFHNDLDDSSIGGGKSVEDFAQYIAAEENITKVKTFGSLDIYQVDIPTEVALIYSPEAQVNYTKINATRYELNVVSSTGASEIYFLQQFDPNWELVGQDFTAVHTTVFDYANAWKINKTGSFSGAIQYKPQSYAEKGRTVSTYAILFVLVYLGGVYLSTLPRKKIPSA